MEELRKLWNQMDRRSLVTIVMVGAIALGFVFPLKSADLPQQLATATESIASIDQQLATANEIIINTDQLVSALIIEIDGVSNRLAQLEAKPDGTPELEAELASLKAELPPLEAGLASLKATVASMQGTTGAEMQGTAVRLQAIEVTASNLSARLAQLEAGAGYDSTFESGVLQRLVALEYALNVTPVQPSSSANDTITYTFTSDNLWHPVSQKTFYGQQFPTESWSFDVSGLSIYLRRIGSPTQAVISLYATGSTGLPVVGAPIWTETVDPSSWATSGAWQTVMFTGVVLPANNTFVVAVSCPLGDENNHIQFAYSTGNDYLGGGLVGTSSAGASWSVTPATDLRFVIYGERN